MLQRISTRRGFTIIELLLAMVMGLVILAAGLSFAVSTMRTFTGGQLREGVYRNARFVNMALERDFQGTGVGIGRTPSFGTLAVWGDTVTILQVPYEPIEAEPYDVNMPLGFIYPAETGTCGGQCVDLLKDALGNLDLAVGDLARLQAASERRLILIQSKADFGTTAQVWFTNTPRILHYQAGLTGMALNGNTGTFVQKLKPIVYYVEGTKLMRAQSFNLDATPAGVVVAEGVQSWNVYLIFVDGDEADEANALDGDDTNDYDDIVGVRIEAVLAADRTDHNVNAGNLFTRRYEWRFAPRNLMYERNR
jgi:prepilin-type N-terminal cleavage/methylation domain-containing protein